MDLDSCLTKLTNRYVDIKPAIKLVTGFLDYRYSPTSFKGINHISTAGIIGEHRDIIAVGIRIDKEWAKSRNRVLYMYLYMHDIEKYNSRLKTIKYIANLIDKQIE